MIILKSCDNEIFGIEEAVALQSQTIKHSIEAGCSDTVIPIPNVTGEILDKVIEYCLKHADADADAEKDKDKEKVPTSSSDESLKAWDANFVKMDLKTLLRLVLAAKYLDIKGLMDLTFRTLADMIKGKTLEEIRQTFNIKNDLTPEEEEVLTRYHQALSE